MDFKNMSYIEIENTLRNCLNTDLRKQNLKNIISCLDSLNTKKFNNKKLSVTFLKNLIDTNLSNSEKDLIIHKIIKNCELKTFDNFRYFKTFNNVDTRELFKFVIA